MAHTAGVGVWPSGAEDIGGAARVGGRSCGLEPAWHGGLGAQGAVQSPVENIPLYHSAQGQPPLWVRELHAAGEAEQGSRDRSPHGRVSQPGRAVGWLGLASASQIHPFSSTLRRGQRREALWNTPSHTPPLAKQHLGRGLALRSQRQVQRQSSRTLQPNGSGRRIPE